MPITIADYIKKCELVNRQILDEQESIVLANENRIISLNVDAFQDGLGSDGKDLLNSDEKYTGIYKNVPGQQKRGLYNFTETGAFLSNIKIDLQPNLVKFDIFSTGTGSGDKALFFKGYNNLFGLNKNNSDIVNYDIIYPELMKFIKKYL